MYFSASCQLPDAIWFQPLNLIAVRSECVQKKTTDHVFLAVGFARPICRMLNEQPPGARGHITTGATQKPTGLPAVDQHTFILGSGDESSQRIRR
jgi:hypothetical protein